MFVGLDPPLHIFLPSDDWRLDQASELARDLAVTAAGESFWARHPRCLTPMNVWFFRADMAAMRGTRATLLTTFGECAGRDLPPTVWVPGASPSHGPSAARTGKADRSGQFSAAKVSAMPTPTVGITVRPTLIIPRSLCGIACLSK